MKTPEPLRRAEPREVEDARGILRDLREQLGLAGGAAAIGGLLGNAAGIAAALPLSLIAVSGLVLLYSFPVTAQGRWAKRMLREWAGGAAAAAGDDSRLRSAEAILERIEEYSGSAAASSAVARAMVQLLYDSQEDLEAVRLLAAAGGEAAPALRARIEARMNHALATIAEVYEAVLAHDDVALREIVARADAEVGRMRAEGEVAALLEGLPPAPRDGGGRR